MKTTLIASLALNIFLLGAAAIFWRHPRVSTIFRIAAPATSPAVNSQMPHGPVVQTVPAPFRWSQLLSTNGYPAFVTNLRAAGCPEATVEDIVRGNTGRAYAMMRERLGVSAMTPGRWSEPAQMQMVAYFLGQPLSVEESPIPEEPPAGSAVAGQNTPADQTTGTSPTQNAALAAFLQNTDFTTPGMTVEQQQEIAGLRQGLLAQISTASQMPNNQTSQSSPGGADNSAPSQAGADDSQPSRSGDSNAQSPHPHGSDTLIQAANQESILAGLFGMGAAVQYDQSRPAQVGQ
jgi:hypothetical protein